MASGEAGAAGTARGEAGRGGNGALWFGMLAGPIAWSLHLLVGYPLVPVACEHGLVSLLHALTAAAGLATLAAGLVAWRRWRRLRRESVGAGTARARFMAVAGMVLSGLFLTAIVFEWVPVLLQSPCL